MVTSQCALSSGLLSSLSLSMHFCATLAFHKLCLVSSLVCASCRYVQPRMFQVSLCAFPLTLTIWNWWELWDIFLFYTPFYINHLLCALYITYWCLYTCFSVLFLCFYITFDMFYILFWMVYTVFNYFKWWWFGHYWFNQISDYRPHLFILFDLLWLCWLQTVDFEWRD